MGVLLPKDGSLIIEMIGINIAGAFALCGATPRQKRSGDRASSLEDAWFLKGIFY